MSDRSIGIIGGADGPTAIFVSGSMTGLILTAVVIAAVIAAIVIIAIKRRKK